jgi:flagellin
MGISINTNVSAMNAGRQMNKVQMDLGKTFEKLSTGLRINRAADDAGRFKIAERFTAQGRGLGQAIRNANDGISLVQTAEGALNETTNIMQRMRELAVQAANGTYSNEDRQSLQDEVTALKSEMDRIAVDTTFNGRKLLDGSFSTSLQVGADAGQTIAISINASEADDFGQIAKQTGATAVGTSGIGASEVLINGVTVNASSSYAESNGRSADSAYAKARAINASNTGARAEAQATSLASATGSVMNGSETLTMNGVTILSGSQGTAVDSYTELNDVINAYSSQTGVSSALNAAGTQITLTAADGRNVDITAANGTGANPFTTGITRGKMQLSDATTITLTDASNRLGFGGSTVIALDTSTIRDLDITSISGATDAIDRVDAALSKIGTRRGELGAIQNRLESTMSNLSNVSENITAARSRLMDVDFASETLNMTKGMMQQQVGAAILSQAKASSQVVMNLLQ